MRSVTGILAALVLSVATHAAAQQDLPKPMLDSQPVTINFQDASLAEVLRFLGNAAGVDIRLTVVGSQPTPITARFADAQLSNVFMFVVRAGNLTYRVVDAKTIEVTSKRP